MEETRLRQLNNAHLMDIYLVPFLKTWVQIKIVLQLTYMAQNGVLWGSMCGGGVRGCVCGVGGITLNLSRAQKHSTHIEPQFSRNR